MSSTYLKPTEAHRLAVEAEMALPTFEETVERMKREIGVDFDAGRHQNAKSFSDLHDNADANEYGGFCEDELGDRFIEHFGGRDRNEGMPQAYLDYMNKAQEAVHDWIAAAGSVAAALGKQPVHDLGETSDFDDTLEIRLSGRLGELVSAVDAAHAIVEDLTNANKGAPALLSNALLPLIARAVALRYELAALATAVRTDAGEA